MKTIRLRTWTSKEQDLWLRAILRGLCVLAVSVGLGTGEIAAQSVLEKTAPGTNTNAPPGSDKPKLEILDSGWEYRWNTMGRWSIMNAPPQALRKNSRQVLEQRIRLPAELPPRPALYLKGPFMYFDLYVGSDLIYRYSQSEEAQRQGAPATPWHIVDLPPDSAGQNLTVRSTSPYFLIGLNGPPRLGTLFDLIRWMIREDLGRLAVAGLSAIVGGIGLGLYLWRRRQPEHGAFALFALAMAVYALRYTQVKQLVTGPTAVWNYLWIASLVMIPVGSIAFVRAVIPSRFDQLLKVLFWIHLAAVLPAIALFYFFPYGLGPLVLLAVRILIVASTGALGIVVFYGAALGNRDARILSLGLVALIAAALYDLSLAFGFIRNGRPQAHLGMLAFVTVLAYIVGKRIADAFDRTEKYARQVEALSEERVRLMDELHDGVGGLMTNIGLMCDVAERREEPCGPVLPKVSELARQGLGEIRMFMRSLDDEERDWTAIAAEFRRHAQSTLGSLGVKFHLDVHFDTYEALLSLAASQYLTLNRVYREILTNVAKHAGASSVDAMLSVTTTTVRLQVVDDGVGYGNAPPSDGGGYGIPAISRRVAAFGGTFDIVRDGGTKVIVVLPLNWIKPQNTQVG
ncbi:MAG: 7TM diverse intracellular signaling domain-containing protein [Alkalispirochaeta sp.]